jgi:hypothetical protein
MEDGAEAQRARRAYVPATGMVASTDTPLLCPRAAEGVQGLMRHLILVCLALATLGPRVASAQGMSWASQGPDSTRVIIAASVTSGSVAGVTTWISVSRYSGTDWQPPSQQRALDPFELAQLKATLDPLYAKYQPSGDLLFVLQGSVTGMAVLPADRGTGKIVVIFDHDIAPSPFGTDIAPLSHLVYSLVQPYQALPGTTDVPVGHVPADIMPVISLR